MVHLFKNPEGQTVFDSPSITDTKLSYAHTKSVSNAEVKDHLGDVAALKQRISELEKKLAEV